jgi:opacity protein-like surface antigen
MVKKSGVGFLLGLVFVLSTCSSAFSQTLFKQDNAYASLNVGLTFLNDIDAGADLNYAGVTANAAGEYQFETGTSVSATYGYILSSLVRTELELGYTEMDHDKAVGSATLTAGGNTLASVGGEVNVDGEVETLYGLASVIFTPSTSGLEGIPFLGLLNDLLGNFTPLVGGGIGFADWEDKVKSASTSAGTLTINGEESDTDFLAAVLAGLEYNVGQDLTAKVTYRHLWIDSGKNGVDDAEADNVSASLAWLF